jgi:hypothetical protein
MNCRKDCIRHAPSPIYRTYVATTVAPSATFKYEWTSDLLLRRLQTRPTDRSVFPEPIRQHRALQITDFQSVAHSSPMYVLPRSPLKMLFGAVSAELDAGFDWMSRDNDTLTKLDLTLSRKPLQRKLPVGPIAPRFWYSAQLESFPDRKQEKALVRCIQRGNRISGRPQAVYVL